MQKQSPMIRNSATSSGGGFFTTHLPRPHKPINEAGAVKIVDVRDFNLICGIAESCESRFSTTYCGYLIFVVAGLIALAVRSCLKDSSGCFFLHFQKQFMFPFLSNYSDIRAGRHNRKGQFLKLEQLLCIWVSIWNRWKHSFQPIDPAHCSLT